MMKGFSSFLVYLKKEERRKKIGFLLFCCFDEASLHYSSLKFQAF